MKAIDLAGYVVQKCLDDKTPITNLQLQKILYFIQLMSIKLDDCLLIDDSDFEAWRFGPVISEVYYAYCVNGGLPINRVEEIKNVPQNVPSYVDETIKKALSKKAWELVSLSHKEGGAWSKAMASHIFRAPMNQDDIWTEAQSFEL